MRTTTWNKPCSMSGESFDAHMKGRKKTLKFLPTGWLHCGVLGVEIWKPVSRFCGGLRRSEVKVDWTCQTSGYQDREELLSGCRHATSPCALLPSFMASLFLLLLLLLFRLLLLLIIIIVIIITSLTLLVIIFRISFSFPA